MAHKNYDDGGNYFECFQIDVDKMSILNLFSFKYRILFYSHKNC
jgi:hypothetical protein